MPSETTDPALGSPTPGPKDAAFLVSQGAPLLLTITDPDDGVARQHVVAVSVLKVSKSGSLPNGSPSYDIQLSFAIGPAETK